jgi:hypothetical protein
MCTNENGRPYYSPFHDAYFFYSEIGDTMGPYPSYKKAMKAMDDYAYYLDHGFTLWQRVCNGARAWLASTKNAANSLT